jgi:hypothetical protein
VEFEELVQLYPELTRKMVMILKGRRGKERGLTSANENVL